MNNDINMESGGMKEKEEETDSTMKTAIGFRWCKRLQFKKCCIGLTFSSILVILSIVLYFSWNLLSPNPPPIEVCYTDKCNMTAAIFRENIDEKVDPCENFFKFACGNFNRHSYAVPITDSNPVILDRKTRKQLKDDLTAINDSDIVSLQQMKKLYDSCNAFKLNSDEEEGEQAIIDLLHSIFQPGFSISKILALIHRETRLMLIFDVSIRPKDENSTINEIYISQAESQVALEEKDFNDETAEFQNYTSSLKDTLRKYRLLFGELSRQNLSNVTANIVEFDKQLLLALPNKESEDIEVTGNYTDLNELNEMFGNHSVFNWVEYFQTLFTGVPIIINQDSRVYVEDMEFVENLGQIFDFTLDKIKQIRQNLLVKILQSLRDHILDSKMIPSEDEDSCFALVKKKLQFLLVHKLIKRNYNDSTINEVKEMLRFITTAFKNGISQSEWMDEESKLRATKKVDAMKVHLGFPDWLPNPSLVDHFFQGLQFGSSLFSNGLQLKKWNFQRELKGFNQTPSADDTWLQDDTFITDINAFNNHGTNEIMVLAGIIQIPFFGMGLRAVDYGGLGFAIGHEIGHSFDNSGIKRDEAGKENTWMSENATTIFETKAECFINQYQDYWRPKLESFLDPKNVEHGNRTLGENIADNLGIRASYEGYHLYIKERGMPEPRLPGLEKYTLDQLFFLSSAQSWCSSTNPSDIKDAILEDEHSPYGLRFLGSLSNYEEFSRVWQCSSLSRMNPELKCDLWG